MKANISMLFYLKKQKSYSQEKAPIYLRITVDGQRAEITTNRYCDASRWNSHGGRAIGTKENTKSLNSYLDNFLAKAYEAHRYLFENNKDITADSIKNQILGKSEKAHMLIETFHEHNRKMENLVGLEFASLTYKRYQVSLQHTQSFLQYKYKINDIDVTKIGTEFISEYDYYLRSVRKCNNNTTIKYIKNFGKIIRICLSNGWIIKNPFLNYKGRIKPVNPIHLTQQELQTLADKKFSIERLSLVRDIFLFCCFTGLAYIDVKKLKADEITTGIDGEQWIFTHRQKTSVRTAIPILPMAEKLIQKYKDHPICQNKNILLPVPSNQKMNAYLKEIADLCGINKSFTSHIARHTFATTVTLSNGVPIETVSQMLGHSSLRQTQHYAKILDLKVSQDMKLLKQRLSVAINNDSDKL